MKFDSKNLKWTREPAGYTIADDKIEIITEPHTDLWQRTYYHFRNDNAPVLQMKTDEKFFSFTVKTEFESKHRFDQCGVVMYLDSENWLKGSIEFENEKFQHLGSVVTNNGYSDWATTEIDADIKSMWYRFSRREDDYCIECSEDGVVFKQMRICHVWNGGGEISFGIYACSPENSSFKATFTNLEITECKWLAHDGQKPDKEIYTKEDLITDLHNMGLKSSDAIMVHSSMKSIGPVEGGADTVVDAFMECFKDGLFMTPTHTWAQMSEEYSLFDPEEEPACVGIIPNIFRKREGVVRSLHPTHSIAAYGPTAEAYVKGEEDVTTPAQPGGCWSRLFDVDAKILLLGCTHARNTYIHAVEEHLDVPERLTEQPVQFQIKMPDGSIKEVAVHRHFNPVQPHISEDYDKLAQAFYDLGAAKKVKFGDAECILCEARKLYEVTEKVLSHEINCIIDRKEIPREWWMKE